MRFTGNERMGGAAREEFDIGAGRLARARNDADQTRAFVGSNSSFLEVEFDGLRAFRHASFYDRQIAFVHRARLELRSNRVVGVGVDGASNAAAGLSVESMKQPVVAALAKTKHFSAVARDQRVEQTVLAMSGARLGHHTRGLVGHDHQRILMNDL